MLSTGATTIPILPGGASSSANSDRYVNGDLTRGVHSAAFTGSQTLEVGDATVYAPVNYSTTSAVTQLDITASTSPGDHTQISGADLDESKTANRTWSLALPG